MFVLIMGVTGSGKTTIGKLLSEAIGWPFYDADDFHSLENVRKMASGVPSQTKIGALVREISAAVGISAQQRGGDGGSPAALARHTAGFFGDGTSKSSI